MRRYKSKLITVLAMALLAGAVWYLGHAGYLHAKAWVAQQLIARAWAHPAGPVRPWTWADMHPVARLSVPRLQNTLYVLSDATDRSLAFGPGVWQGTIDAIGATLVIAGHRDTHFALLRNILQGDAVTLTAPRGSPRNYHVKETRVIDTRHQALAIEPAAGELILVTCYPFDTIDPGGPLRYVVIAEPLRSTTPENVVL